MFYSSGADTGVPSGADLNTYVRNSVSDADLVVAIITPSFCASSYCIAELGAAWSRAGNLIPLAVRATQRPDLDGVLRGMAIRNLDEAAALDELHDRITGALNKRTRATTWGQYRDEWLGRVEGHLRALEAVASAVVSAAACSRADNHMELFWTDGSGRVFHRWWLGAGWSDVRHWDDPSAVYLAAVSRERGDQLLFGMPRRGRVWMRRWQDDPGGGKRPGAVELLSGEVVGPLTAVSRGSRHVELAASTPAGEQCHRWCHDDRWTNWTTEWTRST